MFLWEINEDPQNVIFPRNPLKITKYQGLGKEQEK